MPRRKASSQIDQIEDAIRKASSIGALECLAGIDSSTDDRTAFWRPFSVLPGSQGLDAGVAELKRRIRRVGQLGPP